MVNRIPRQWSSSTFDCPMITSLSMRLASRLEEYRGHSAARSASVLTNTPPIPIIATLLGWPTTPITCLCSFSVNSSMEGLHCPGYGVSLARMRSLTSSTSRKQTRTSCASDPPPMTSHATGLELYGASPSVQLWVASTEQGFPGHTCSRGRPFGDATPRSSHASSPESGSHRRRGINCPSVSCA